MQRDSQSEAYKASAYELRQRKRALQADEAVPAFQSEFAAGTGTYRQKDEEEKGRSSQC